MSEASLSRRRSPNPNPSPGPNLGQGLHKKLLWVIPEREGGIKSYSDTLWPSVREICKADRFQTEEPLFVRVDRASRIDETVKRIKAIRPNLIHIQHEYGMFGSKVWPFYTFPNWLIRLRQELPSTKIVVTAHNVLQEDYRYPLMGRGWQIPFRWFINRFALKWLKPLWNEGTWGGLDGVVVHSDRQTQVVEKAGAKEVDVIPLFVPDVRRDVNVQLRPSEVPLPKDPHEGFRRDRKTVMVFGFFSHEKGQDIAIAALPHLPKNVQLLLAGGARRIDDYDYMENCISLSRKLKVSDRVSITGFVGDRHLDDLYERADLVLTPFRDSHGSWSITQAFARGVPVLASDLGLNRELDEREPGCLEFFKSEDPRDCAKKILDLLESQSKLEDLKGHGLKYADANNPEKIAEKHLGFYEKVWRN